MRVLSILHPFPSTLNAALVASIVLIAGGTWSEALPLAAAMLGIQFSIGVTNDLVDEPSDRAVRRNKPLVRGALRRKTATRLAVALGAAGLAVAATQGLVQLALLACMYASGLAYDFGLKRLGLGWLAYAVAFPLLPAYAWFGAMATLPPRYEVLLPLAVLAGPALALTNGLVDEGRDRAAGERTVVVRLGRRAALTLMAGSLAVVHGVAWATIGPAPVWLVGLVAGASFLAMGGVALSALPRTATRERGWQAQTTATAILAASWFVAMVLAGRSG
jgi:4-hydroxybenzoate polyprenyltransferase